MNRLGSQFMREVHHRANLLIEGFNPGKALNWVRNMDNRYRLFCLQNETRKYLSGELSPQEVSEFWYRLDDLAIKDFIYCLETGA